MFNQIEQQTPSFKAGRSEYAIALNPYEADLMATLAQALNLAGRCDEAIGWMEKALRYNPQPPVYYRQWLMALHFWGAHDEAGSRIKAMLDTQPDSCVEYAKRLFAGYEVHLPVDFLLDALRDAGVPE